MRGDTVQTILFFPSRTLKSKLCASPVISKYFQSNKWRFTPQPKHQAVDFNNVASVKEVHLIENDSRTIAILVKAEDPENDVLTYNYKVSAGRIIGVGAKVIWNLSDVDPGTYTVTASVDDGAGLRGRYITKPITVK
jgi:hypothetical protein